MKFVKAELEIFEIETEDIITTSGLIDGGIGGEGDLTGGGEGDLTGGGGNLNWGN